MFTIRKKFKFEAAHRLSSSYSKCCQGIHGHSYIVEVFFRSEHLNQDGMVIDFGLVSEKVKELFDAWDHALLLEAAENPNITQTFQGVSKVVLTNWNPTAENMAREIYYRLYGSFPQLYKVRVHETDSGYAEYQED